MLGVPFLVILLADLILARLIMPKFVG